MRSTTRMAWLAVLCLSVASGCWAPSAGELAGADYGRRPSDTLAAALVRQWVVDNLPEPEHAQVSVGALEQGWFRVEGLVTSVRYAWKLPVTIDARNSVGGATGPRPWEFFFRGEALVGVGEPEKRLGSRGRHTVINYVELDGADGAFEEPRPGEPAPTTPEPGAAGEAAAALTRAAFERVELGMSPEQVVALLGPPDQVPQDGPVGPARFLLYLWISADGERTVNCLFQAERLIQKLQRGLAE